MNTTSSTSPTRRGVPRWLRWVLAAAAFSLITVSFAAYRLLTLPSEATQLRDGLQSVLGSQLQTRVQLSAGPILLSAVRVGSLFFKDLPAEARLALQSVKQASVGVYARHKKLPADERTRMFVTADTVMQRRGWIRAVGVLDARNVVLIYVPEVQLPGTAGRVCIAVCNDENLVVVSGSVRLAPLVELAARSPLLVQR